MITYRKRFWCTACYKRQDQTFEVDERIPKQHITLHCKYCGGLLQLDTSDENPAIPAQATKGFSDV